MSRRPFVTCPMCKRSVQVRKERDTAYMVLTRHGHPHALGRECTASQQRVVDLQKRFGRLT